MTDDALNFSVEKMYATHAEALAPVDEWLVRRMASFGGSEMGALAIALGERKWDAERDPKKLEKDARLLFARKASSKLPRITKAKARDRARNTAQEIAALRAWVNAGCPGAPTIDPSTVRHESELRREHEMPIVDRYAHRIAVTPDADACDMFGANVDISIKTTWPTVRHGGLPWQHEMQSLVTLGATNRAWGLVVTWLGGARLDGERGGFVVDLVERDDEKIEQLRAMAARGWAHVEAMMEKKR
jgi:hypothetical protein